MIGGVARPEERDELLLDERDPDFLRASDRAYGPLVATVERAAREGYLRDVDPIVVAAAAWSLVHGLASLWLSARMHQRTGARDAGRLTASVAKLFVDGVMRQGGRD
jgi:hypothetical protein